MRESRRWTALTTGSYLPTLHPHPPLPNHKKCLHFLEGCLLTWRIGVSPVLHFSRASFPSAPVLTLCLKHQCTQTPVGSFRSPSASCLSPPGARLWLPSWPSQCGMDAYVARSLPRLCSVQSENSALKAEHMQTVDQLTAQHEALRGSFREQVGQLQEEHRRTVETLQQQLCRLEAQLLQPRSEPATRSMYLRWGQAHGVRTCSGNAHVECVRAMGTHTECVRVMGVCCLANPPHTHTVTRHRVLWSAPWHLLAKWRFGR